MSTKSANTLIHPWKIIQDHWDAQKHQGAESLFSLGNGHMGQRANFEEHYSGAHLQGSYVAGIYYPDKTRVGWWKNGYPEYFAKVLNSVNWIGIDIIIDDERLDLATAEVEEFGRELDMHTGLLKRTATVKLKNGKRIQIQSERFLSMERKEIGAIEYRLKALGSSCTARITPYLDFDVKNHDSNYDEKFWSPLIEQVGSQKAVISAATKKLDFQVAAAMRFEFYEGEEHHTLYPETEKREKYAANTFEVMLKADTDYTLYKYAAIVSNLNHPKEQLAQVADKLASEAFHDGYAKLREEHTSNWANRWEEADIQIEGDDAAQQGIRFNIFHLTQTYTGEDPRLNIGPKGFTGEKYGGSTYWDTEAYCLPFYMASAGKEVAKNLLVYRYRHLPKAIENAEKLGFTKGAALYPMVTMNGEECHNEWEITFEEIHRNGAIAYAIFNYIRYFDDPSYLMEGGLEVLIGIARFWAQRVNWSEARGKYVMLGVTGPNEYENNINNNWYTNYIARWCLRYTLECADWLAEEQPQAFSEIIGKTQFARGEEGDRWTDIIEKMHLPEDEELGIFLQQDNYLDKEQRTAADLNPAERPINQHWSWDRILRSCFIKQADVLQGMYFFESDFSKEQLQRNFDFYEPRTLHESSLSPCVHVVLAASLDKLDKAYELYLRTSRLDLDDYNREIHEGLHITSMAGTWLSVVEGFAGMRIVNGALHFAPKLPAAWKALVFKVRFGGALLHCRFSPGENQVEIIGEGKPEVYLNGNLHQTTSA